MSAIRDLWLREGFGDSAVIENRRIPLSLLRSGDGVTDEGDCRGEIFGVEELKFCWISSSSWSDTDQVSKISAALYQTVDLGHRLVAILL